MHRYVAWLLCVITAVGVAVGVAGVLLAAPAPFPRPGRTGPWFDGWERVVDPLGECRFERKGDRLTITVPGKGHALDPSKGRLTGPCLLRAVEGDFIMQVRVGEHFTPGKAAGILLMDGKRIVRVWRHAVDVHDKRLDHLYVEYPSQASTYHRPLGARPTYLRFERRGNRLTVAYSVGVEQWLPLRSMQVTLSRKVKVGVEAFAAGQGTFRAWFDQFRLTPVDPLTRPGR
jgi:regulation of enolase protein 1 (concanavalin A-like superfamily)